MTSWHSYPKIWNLGHAYLADLLADDVIVEEKVDGSQFSFGMFGGELKCRSKGQEIVVDAPEKLFQLAIDQVKKISHLLQDGWTYRGEYLAKPKHNALAYDRVPNNNIIIFDINNGEETYMPYSAKQIECERLGLEIVPLLFIGKVLDATVLFALLERVSILGGQKIEGFVIKNYAKFGVDKKVLMGKHVSEAFKEVHKGNWQNVNPGNTDFVMALAEKYRTPARWNKAVQHLKERGELENSPKDIGKFLKEINVDIEAECEIEIKAKLYEWAIPKIKRVVCRGAPEHYKNLLLESQFDKTTEVKVDAKV